MHHFASFNNQFYRKSIEYMQDVVGHAAEQVVRRLPRSRRLLQRPLRAADQGADRHARSARRPRLHLVPLDRPRGQHAWATAASRSSIRRCTSSPPARTRASDAARLLPDLSQSGAAPPHVHEAVHAAGLGRVLLRVPQGASGRSGEQLPLVPRLQRLRQLAGQRRSGQGARSFYYPPKASDLRRLPHAAGAFAAIPGNQRRQGALAPLPAANTAVPFVNHDATAAARPSSS